MHTTYITPSLRCLRYLLFSSVLLAVPACSVLPDLEIESLDALGGASASTFTAESAAAPAPKKMEHPHLTVEGSVATGDYELDLTGVGVDETDAILGRIRFEVTSNSGFGGGVNVQYMVSDDDLNVPTAQTEVTETETYFFFLAQIAAGDHFRMPIRIGPYIGSLGGDDNTSDDILWLNFGTRVELEPEVAFVTTDKVEVSAFAAGSVGVHISVIDDDSTAETYSSSGFSSRFETGVRARFSKFSIGMAYTYRQTYVDESDAEGGIFIREVEGNFDGIIFSMGLRF